MLQVGMKVMYSRAFVRNIGATNMPEIAKRKGIIVEVLDKIVRIQWDDNASISAALQCNITKCK